jgi:hypothetical protein
VGYPGFQTSCSSILSHQQSAGLEEVSEEEVLPRIITHPDSIIVRLSDL